ncbi:MAG: aldo/keto reductase [Bacteroidota bacterium]
MKTMTENSYFVLNNTMKMPKVGLGVLFAKNDKEVEKAVISALSSGYRKIDTASAYENEEGVGRGIQQSGVERNQIFLTTKVWNTEQGYDSTLAAIERSLNRLETDYVDLYLIHWPVKTKFKDTYWAMERIYEKGLAKAIGVCNFSVNQLQDLMEHSQVVPAVNQVEVHPHHSQSELLDFARKHGIQLEAWRPIMMGEVLKIPELVEIGKNYNKSAVQVSLRWLLQRDIAVIPKSVTPKRIQDNLDIFDFELSSQEMNVIGNLNQNKSLGEDLSHVF